MRLEPPAPIQPRITTTDVEVAGVRIAGEVGQPGHRRRQPRPGGSPVPSSTSALSIVATSGSGRHPPLPGIAPRPSAGPTTRHRRNSTSGSPITAAPGVDPVVVWPSGTLHLVELPLVFVAPRARDAPRHRQPALYWPRALLHGRLLMLFSDDERGHGQVISSGRSADAGKKVAHRPSPCCWIVAIHSLSRKTFPLLRCQRRMSGRSDPVEGRVGWGCTSPLGSGEVRDG